ncbi:MAG: UPF0182 family protein, partial [Pseudoclavibacter sp.]|nr:UPF0182 family protein [Pseudoclavibacter sp.]
MSTSSAANPAQPNRPGRTSGGRPRPLVLTLVVVAALIAAFFWLAGFYADILWYEQLGYLGVLLTRWGASAAMFGVGLLGMAVPLVVTLQIAYRTRPVYAKLGAQLDRYQEIVEPLRRGAMIAIPVVLGVFAGAALSTTWQAVLMWLHATPFGQVDPRFGMDVGFYVFHLPFWRGVVAFASAVLLACLLLTAATCYLYGSIRVTGRDVVISKAARTQIAILAGLYLLAQAVSLWLDRYALLTSTSTSWTGAMYTDANARIPGLAILAGASLIVAALFFLAAVLGRWRLPLFGTALLVVVGLVVSAAYPALVQQFQVRPSELQLEEPYLQNNIDATRAAYGLDRVEEVEYNAQTTAEPGQLRSDAVTTANIRILDPALVSPTFAQIQQERSFYAFREELSVDRYRIDGEVKDAVGGVREVNTAGLEAGQQTWVNTTLVYTHGYGLVTASGSQRQSDGLPYFLEGGMPSEGVLPEFTPQIYFGQNSPQYSIVGRPDGAEPIEFDHVSDSGEARSTFEGSGGPNIGGFFNRLVYAIKFQSEQILLSEYVNDNSQILYDRDPALRVSKAAPYLHIDSKPYPSVVDGRVVWIVDGYTTTDLYPYSQAQSLDQLVSEQPGSTPPFNRINYIRNSVKATVDAYTGQVVLYAWDPNDPLLQSWQQVFPNTLRPISEMSGELMSHVRYPEDIFKVQRSLLASYHIKEAGSFYNGLNAWELPLDPTAPSSESRVQQPYYLTMKMPDQDPAFSIYSTFIPRTNSGANTRNVLTGFLAANANAGGEDGQVSEDYGRLTLLRITNDNINGPGQMQNIFNSDGAVAPQLNLLERGGQTAVLRGNLLTLPVGGGFLYVQPVYVKSTGNT